MDAPAEKTRGPLVRASVAGSVARGGLLPAADAVRAWSLASLAGHLAEVSDSGAAPSLTAAASLILEGQERGEPTAWIGLGRSIFFPPDLAEWGIDLEALPVIRAPGADAAFGAADQLLRSGAFGLVVLDLEDRTRMPLAVQSRLAALAREHHALLLCLTRKRSGAPSLGPRVSLHGEGRISRAAFNRFDWQIRVVKDRRGAPGWSHTESCRGADGLC